MTHVVTENCIKCKFTDCVEVRDEGRDKPGLRVLRLATQLQRLTSRRRP